MFYLFPTRFILYFIIYISFSIRYILIFLHRKPLRLKPIDTTYILLDLITIRDSGMANRRRFELSENG